MTTAEGYGTLPIRDEGPAVASYVQLERAVELALSAPSVHNTQPWRWRIGLDRVELHADLGRHLAGTDPEHRDLVISCGAALHHLRVALAGTGLASRTTVLPDPENRYHLATVQVVSGRPDPADAAFYGQLNRRRTDRRGYRAEPVPEAVVGQLVAAAAAQGAVLRPVTDPERRQRLLALLDDAAARQPHTPGYLAELMNWTHRYADARDGVPSTAVPGRGAGMETRHLQRFPAGTLRPDVGSDSDAGTLLALCTRRDDEAGRLTAGEATSAVLLTATRAGLASAPLSQAVEIATTRDLLQREVLGVPEHPQLLIRVGRAPARVAALHPTPRRSIRSVLLG